MYSLLLEQNSYCLCGDYFVGSSILLAMIFKKQKPVGEAFASPPGFNQQITQR